MTTRPTPRWPSALAVGLTLATLVVVGCTGRTPPAAVVPTKASGSADGTASAAPTPAPGDAKVIAHWPDDLAGVLVISGEMIGYTEPCGCTAGQRGGLTRRLILTDLMRTERKWPVALIDLGNLINDPFSSHGGGPEETKIKFDTTLKALSMLKYSAVALGADDLKIGIDEALVRMLNGLSDSADAPKFVAANVKPPEGFEKRIVPSVRKELGPRKIGITAVMDPDAYAKLQHPAKDMLTVSPPEEALGSVLSDLEKDTDLQVLMVQGPPALAKKLGLAYPGFDVVVATSDQVEPDLKPTTLNGGTTWLVSPGRKGQFVVTLGLSKDKTKPPLYQRVDLGTRYDPYKKRGEPMRKLIDEEFVNDLKSAGILASYLKKPYAFNGADPSKASYVGAETCKACHPNTYNKWLSTKHAKAYEGLTSNPKRNREADADCVRCHTTGFEYVGGFLGATETPHLKGNQCENCHGPGSLHAASPDDKALIASVTRSAEDFQKNSRCLVCHDEDNSPHGFDFPAMWSQVMHKGLDDYKDPKVHQGIKAAKP